MLASMVHVTPVKLHGLSPEDDDAVRSRSTLREKIAQMEPQDVGHDDIFFSCVHFNKVSPVFSRTRIPVWPQAHSGATLWLSLMRPLCVCVYQI